MLSRNLFVVLLVGVITKDAVVVSKPCFDSLNAMIESLFGKDDSSEESDETIKKPTTTTEKPIPQTITVLLTPTADLTSLPDFIKNSTNGSIYLLPGLFPLQSGDAATTAAPPATTAAPPPTTAAPVAAPAAAPPAAAPAAPAAGATTAAPAAATTAAPAG